MRDKPTDIEIARAKRLERAQSGQTVAEMESSLAIALSNFEDCIAAGRPLSPVSLAQVLAAARYLAEIFEEDAECADDPATRDNFLACAARSREAEARFRAMPVDENLVEEAATALYNKLREALGEEDTLTRLVYCALSIGGPLAQLAAMAAYYSYREYIQHIRESVEDGSAARKRAAAAAPPRSPFWHAWTQLDFALGEYRELVAESDQQWPAPKDLFGYFSATRFRLREDRCRRGPVQPVDSAGTDTITEDEYLAHARRMFRAVSRLNNSDDPNILIARGDDDLVD